MYTLCEDAQSSSEPQSLVPASKCLCCQLAPCVLPYWHTAPCLRIGNACSQNIVKRTVGYHHAHVFERADTIQSAIVFLSNMQTDFTRSATGFERYILLASFNALSFSTYDTRVA